VIDKNRVPPSGNKHDYLSLGLYWWPNPKKKNGLPYIQLDGKINPENQRGSDRIVLGKMAMAVETLALAYYLCGNHNYAEHAVDLIRTWFLDPATKMNPHLRYSQTIPGRRTITGLGIIDSLSLTSVVDAIGLLGSCPAWTSNDQEGMLAWFSAFLEWLQSSKHGKKERSRKNNHGTWHDVQTAGYALFLGRTEMAREILESSNKKRFCVQIRPDGRQRYALKRTRTFHYTTYNLNALFELSTMAATIGINLWDYTAKDGRGIRKALDFVAPYIDPEKTWPYPERLVKRSKLLHLLLRAASVYKNSQYEELIEIYYRKEGKGNEVALRNSYLLATYCRARLHILDL
jgi:hypothetical protein